MNRKRLWAGLGILGVLVGLLLLSSGRPSREPATGTRGPNASPRQTRGRKLARIIPSRKGRKGPGAPWNRAHPSEREDKVRGALERFRQETDAITPEAVTEEFRKVREAKAEFERRATPSPSVEPFTDDSGTRWNKLIYETGGTL